MTNKMANNEDLKKSHLKERKREEEDDEEVEFGPDSLKNLDLGLDCLVGWLKQPNIQKMVTRGN